jgi:hypothetical protein
VIVEKSQEYSGGKIKHIPIWTRPDGAAQGNDKVINKEITHSDLSQILPEGDIRH